MALVFPMKWGIRSSGESVKRACPGCGLRVGLELGAENLKIMEK